MAFLSSDGGRAQIRDGERLAFTLGGLVRHDARGTEGGGPPDVDGRQGTGCASLQKIIDQELVRAKMSIVKPLEFARQSRLVVHG